MVQHGLPVSAESQKSNWPLLNLPCRHNSKNILYAFEDVRYAYVSTAVITIRTPVLKNTGKAVGILLLYSLLHKLSEVFDSELFIDFRLPASAGTVPDSTSESSNCLAPNKTILIT